MAKSVKVEKGIIIKDQDTGAYYCVTIKSGEIVKIFGEDCNAEPASTGSGGAVAGESTETTESGIENQESGLPAEEPAIEPVVEPAPEPTAEPSPPETPVE